MKLGTAILVLPLRDPRVLARQAMTLQALSGGRLMLGVGIGDYPKRLPGDADPLRREEPYYG